MSSDTLYWVWLADRLGPGSRRLPELMLRYDSAYEIYRATDEELMGFDADGNEKLSRLRDKSLDAACKTIEFCSRNGVEIIPYTSEKYPARLKKLQDPPAVLYVRGKLPKFDDRVCIAVVGTRKMSEYGKTSAYKISYELAEAGAVVVSGMALGVDAVAACGALSAKKETVAVFGCGIDRVYPAKHKRLMSKILENGCVISEYPPHTEPRGYNFPMRNRIISGLCNGTIVIEADESSGAMITARDAIIQGRDIFALPGNIDTPGSQGTNRLIHEGAQPARSALDILENYRELYSDSLSFEIFKRSSKRSDYDPSRAKYFGLDYIETKENKISEPSAYPIPENKTAKASEKVKEEDSKVNEGPKRAQNAEMGLDEKTRAVYSAIKEGCDTRLDAIVPCGLPMAHIMAALTVLEIKGLIEQVPGGAYRRK